MSTRNHVIVGLIILIVFAVAAWSKLRFIDEEDHGAQRWRLDEHPAFKRDS